MKLSFKDVLPEYPSTRHLPWKPNSKGDKIASESECQIIFTGDFTSIQEKIDGANCGMCFFDGHPVVRNRTKILRKGQELKNPSLKQFSSSWNWMHENKEKFKILADFGPYSIYGEWMIQQHGMEYDLLPDWFIAYDLFDYENQKYIDPYRAESIFRTCGFKSIPISFYADPKIQKPLNFEFIETVANFQSWFSKTEKREGVIVKASDGKFITNKFKMVRQGFEQGCLLGDVIKKNSVSPEWWTQNIEEG